MSTVSFSIFPNDNFIDLCLYQYGKEQCDPGHSFGPATRNHYLFHYVLSGTGTLMADNSKGITQTYYREKRSGISDFSRADHHLFCRPGASLGICLAGI